MATITFTIDNGKIDRIKDALAGLHPIPGSDGPGDPEFTKAECAKECARRWIIRQVARWEQKVAREACVYNEEDDLIT